MKLNLEQKYQAITAKGEVAELDLKTLLSFSDKTLLYFYPKDNTPGCTLENKDFSCLKDQFAEKGITVIGVSKDSIESHKKFIESQDLKVDLISDPNLALHKELSAYGEKNNYGKIVMGVIRSTFLLNKQGEILGEWRNIRATGHAERILKKI
ncbi:peroxiredoxin [Candidatus Gracilibacteria bacterium 28_42_T64]|nr:peroxiredoxin [Candidatus Gracilibacteria bacterium 28_42_T64]